MADDQTSITRTRQAGIGFCLSSEILWTQTELIFSHDMYFCELLLLEVQSVLAVWPCETCTAPQATILWLQVHQRVFCFLFDCFCLVTFTKEGLVSLYVPCITKYFIDALGLPLLIVFMMKTNWFPWVFVFLWRKCWDAKLAKVYCMCSRNATFFNEWVDIFFLYLTIFIIGSNMYLLW